MLAEDEIYNIEWNNKEYNIFNKVIGEYIYFFTVNEIANVIVFYRNKLSDYEKRKDDVEKYLKMLPIELSSNKRRIHTNNIHSFLETFIGKESTSKFCNDLNIECNGNLLDILDLFNIVNNNLEKINDEEKKFDTKFDLYRIIETL